MIISESIVHTNIHTLSVFLKTELRFGLIYGFVHCHLSSKVHENVPGIRNNVPLSPFACRFCPFGLIVGILCMGYINGKDEYTATCRCNKVICVIHRVIFNRCISKKIIEMAFILYKKYKKLSETFIS